MQIVNAVNMMHTVNKSTGTTVTTGTCMCNENATLKAPTPAVVSTDRGHHGKMARL